MKYCPDTYNFDVFFTLWMKKLLKIWKLTNMLGLGVNANAIYL